RSDDPGPPRTRTAGAPAEQDVRPWGAPESVALGLSTVTTLDHESGQVRVYYGSPDAVGPSREPDVDRRYRPGADGDRIDRLPPDGQRIVSLALPGTAWSPTVPVSVRGTRNGLLRAGPTTLEVPAGSTAEWTDTLVISQ